MFACRSEAWLVVERLMRLKVPVWNLVSRPLACTNSNNELRVFSRKKRSKLRKRLNKISHRESATKACHPYARTRPRDKTSFPRKGMGRLNF